MDNITQDTWRGFCKETVAIQNKRLYWVIGLYVFLMVLYRLPWWVVPALNQSSVEEFDLEAYQRAEFWYNIYMGVLLSVVATACYLIICGEGMHRELQAVQNKYSAHFCDEGINLLYIRDPSGGYWVFRPATTGNLV